MTSNNIAMIGDFPTCQFCGAALGWWSQHICQQWPPAQPIILPSLPSVACDHCFCLREKPQHRRISDQVAEWVSVKSHERCCSCGSRRLKPKRVKDG